MNTQELIDRAEKAEAIIAGIIAILNKESYWSGCMEYDPAVISSEEILSVIYRDEPKSVRDKVTLLVDDGDDYESISIFTD